MVQRGRKRIFGEGHEKKYFAAYYADHKTAISRKRRARYQTDSAVQEQARSRSLVRHQRIREEREKLVAQGAIEPSHGVRGYNKPRLFPMGGGSVLVRGVAEFADKIGKTVLTVRKWERDGIIPQPTVRDERGRRWYSDKHIEIIGEAVKEFEEHPSRSREDFKLVVNKKWKEAGL